MYPVGHRDHVGVTSRAADNLLGGLNTQAVVRSASFSRLAARFSSGPRRVHRVPCGAPRPCWSHQPGSRQLVRGINTQAVVGSASFSRLAARFSSGPRRVPRVPGLRGLAAPPPAVAADSHRQPQQTATAAAHPTFAPVETQPGAAGNRTWWSRDDEGGLPRVW